MRDLKGLDHIGIRVSDFESSIEFYKAFGFELQRADIEEGVRVLAHKQGPTLNLLDSTTKTRAIHNVLMDEETKHTGYTHIALIVQDIAKTVDYINNLGHEITEGPVSFSDGKTSIFIRDPDRNVIEFTQSTQTVQSATYSVENSGGEI